MTQYNPKASLQQLMENYADLTDWQIVREPYRQREIEKRKPTEEFVRDILAKYPLGISSSNELRADHHYSLIAFLDDELQASAYYGVNPENINPLFVEVMTFLSVDLVGIAKEREEAAKHIGHGSW